MDRYHFSFSVNIFRYILEKKIYVRVTKTFLKVGFLYWVQVQVKVVLRKSSSA